MDYFQLRKNLNLQEKFKLPKPPFDYYHIVGFEGKFKMNVESMHPDNESPAVIKDIRKGLKIVEKHLKKQGMRYNEKEVLNGPMDVAKKEKLKVGEGDTDFCINIYPGASYGKNPKLPSGKEQKDINLDDMVIELGKLKSFANFPRTDFQANYGGENPNKGRRIVSN